MGVVSALLTLAPSMARWQLLLLLPPLSHFLLVLASQPLLMLVSRLQAPSSASLEQLLEVLAARGACLLKLQYLVLTTHSASATSIGSKVPSAAVIGGSIAAIGLCIFFLRRRWHTQHLQSYITPLDGLTGHLEPKSPDNVHTGEKHHIILSSPLFMPDSFTQTVPSNPAQNLNHSGQQAMLDMGDDVQSQMALMKSAILRMMEHIRRIEEAQIDSEINLRPPTYISS